MARHCRALFLSLALLTGHGNAMPLLAGEPFFVGFGRVDCQKSAHTVMSEAAKLGAGDLIISDLLGDEPDGNVLSRDRVLRNSHLTNRKSMDHVLRADVNDRRLTDG